MVLEVPERCVLGPAIVTEMLKDLVRGLLGTATVEGLLELEWFLLELVRVEELERCLLVGESSESADSSPELVLVLLRDRLGV